MTFSLVATHERIEVHIAIGISAIALVTELLYRHFR